MSFWCLFPLLFHNSKVTSTQIITLSQALHSTHHYHILLYVGWNYSSMPKLQWWFNWTAVWIRAWMNNYIPQIYEDVYTHPCLNTLRLRQNGRHFADDTFNRIFVNEYVKITIKFSPKFVPKGPINNIPALVQIMAWRRPGDKPLSEPVMVSLLTHICVTRPHWVK